MNKEDLYRLFAHIPPIRTERLILRGMRIGDTADMYAYASIPEVSEYLTWEPHESEEKTREYLARVGQCYREGRFFDWAVICRADHHMIGTCGFTTIDTLSDAGEIGYVLNPHYRHCGYATEAAEAVLDYGFRELSLHRIEARFIQGNTDSRRLTERIGMRFEGWARESMKIKGQYRTIGTAAILKSEYDRHFPESVR